MGNFEFNGEKYKKASKHQKEWGNSLISQMQLNGNEDVLDLGCGDGVLTEQIALRIPDGTVLGVDASGGMIQTAKKIKKHNLRFVQMDINDMEFRDEFDIIFSNAALHWIKDHALLLKHSFEALKSGGSIYWNFAGDGTCRTFNTVMEEIMQQQEYQAFFKDFEWPWFMPSKAEYDLLAGTIGFSEVRVIEENKDRYFADVDEMVRWIDQPSIVPFLQNVPDENKEDFRQEVIQNMIDRTQQPDGTCFETFRRINFYAKK